MQPRRTTNENYMNNAQAAPNTTSAEHRAQQIKTRRLEIAADLIERRRAYIVDGIERPYAERVTLEAEDAALALEAREILVAAEVAKIERRKRLSAELLSTLIDVLTERGLLDVLDQARKRSAQAIEKMGSPS